MREGGPIEKYKMREGGSEKKSLPPLPYSFKWNSPNYKIYSFTYYVLTPGMYSMKIDNTLSLSWHPKYWTIRSCWMFFSSWISHSRAFTSWNQKWKVSISTNKIKNILVWHVKLTRWKTQISAQNSGLMVHLSIDTDIRSMVIIGINV